jgi:hypothetical protein
LREIRFILRKTQGLSSAHGDHEGGSQGNRYLGA